MMTGWKKTRYSGRSVTHGSAGAISTTCSTHRSGAGLKARLSTSPHQLRRRIKVREPPHDHHKVRGADVGQQPRHRGIRIAALADLYESMRAGPPMTVSSRAARRSSVPFRPAFAASSARSHLI
jgi:hypothetical protein